MSSREHAYQFLAKYFQLRDAPEHEIPVGDEIESYSELAGGLPKDNLTILGLARKLGEITRSPMPSDAGANPAWAAAEREKLRAVIRFRPSALKPPWLEANSYRNQVESVSYRFETESGLPFTGVWLRETGTASRAPLTIVLNDNGKKAAGSEEWERLPEIGTRLERGEQVLAVDLLFSGDAVPDQPSLLFTEMLAASGDRPLGLEAAQLIAVTRWAEQEFRPTRIRLESTGLRTQVQALVAAALEPGLYSQVVAHQGMHSLSYLLEKPVPYELAPDVFCLDLYKEFDLDRLRLLAAPTRVIQEEYLEISDREGHSQ